MYIGLHVKYSLFLSDFSETRSPSTDISKNVKFHGNPSSRSRVVPCRQTDVTHVTVAFAILRNRLKFETVLIKQ